MDYFLEASKIHRKVWNLFDYVRDNVQYDQMEHWTSHADAVNLGLRFKDDCDGFALTCAELLLEKGVPKHRVSIIYCTTETGEGHLVCGVYYEGKTFILDNRYEMVYDWNNRSGYSWNYFMLFDDPGKWYKVDER